MILHMQQKIKTGFAILVINNMVIRMEFLQGINKNTEFDTTKDAYRTFKLLVNGYLTL